MNAKTDNGKSLQFSLKQEIRARTYAGEKIKPLARDLGVSRNTVRRYKFKLQP